MSEKRVAIPQDELFEMLDIANEMVGFCSAWMPGDRYYAVANAVWVIAHRASGDDATADKLKAKLMAARERYFARFEEERAALENPHAR